MSVCPEMCTILPITLLATYLPCFVCARVNSSLFIFKERTQRIPTTGVLTRSLENLLANSVQSVDKHPGYFNLLSKFILLS